MNLVQINERLKDLPMQVLQQYANGMNPEVPPYLALGELQRREMSQKQMATAQGAQGPQSSIKEQVEQKAGLMELQQMQQQQAMQQMQQPRGPMPTPAGVPQPEVQPEAMMARGGLASVPVRRDMFEYAGGGIIAFQAGGQPKYETRYDKMNRENRERAAQDEPRVISVPPGTSAQEVEMIRLQNPDAIVQTGEEGGKLQALMDKIKGAVMYSSDAEAMKQRERVASTPPASVSEAQATAMAGPQAQVPVGLPAALQKAAPAAAPVRSSAAMGAPDRATVLMPGTPRPVQAGASAPAAQAGLPAALDNAPEFTPTPVSPDRAEVEAMMKAQRREAPTADRIKSDVSALMPAGMQEEAMQKRFAEQRARADARERGYKESQPTGLQNLIRVLGQAGQYKGFSGVGPAYTALQQQRRAEDLAFQKQQDELMTAIEDREYGADKDVFSTRSAAMDRAQQLFGQSEKSILEAAAKKYEVSQGALTKDNEARMKLDAEKFKAIQGEKLKRLELGSQEQRVKWQLANQNIIEKQGVEYVNLMAQSRALEEKGDKAGAERLAARAKDILTLRGGSSGAAGGGAGAAGRNQVAERRQTMQELQQIIKDEGMVYTDAEKANAARQYQRLVMQNVGEGDGGAASGGAPSAAVDALRKNPGLAAQFDQKYGKGAAAQYLQK